MPDFIAMGMEVPKSFDCVETGGWRRFYDRTPVVYFEYLRYMSELMQWLATEGRTLLDKDVLKEDEYILLSGKMYHLLYQSPQSRPVCLLFMKMLDKGTSSIIYTIQHDRKATYNKYSEWIQYLTGKLQSGRLFGIGSHLCKNEESKVLIENMIPIAQLLENDGLLENISFCRYPKDMEARKWFVEHHKNW